MEPRPVGEAIAWLEKANADLDPELLTMDAAREVLAEYARAERLVAFGKAALTRRLDDAGVIARMTGTSIGKAKETVETTKRLRDSDEVSGALQAGDISFEQAAEISRTEQSRPGSARELIDTIMRYFCPRCGTAVERRGASFMAVTHLRCASCGQDAKFTYSDKLALFERTARAIAKLA